MGSRDEADISVNGVQLTVGQSMALRVALTNYLAAEAGAVDMDRPYWAGIREVLDLIVTTEK